MADSSTIRDGKVKNGSRINSPNRDQSVTVYDLVSEGPIQGLVGAGIYLNGAEVVPNSGTSNPGFVGLNPGFEGFSSDVNYNATDSVGVHAGVVTDNNGILAQEVDLNRLQYIVILSGKKFRG